MSRIIITTAVFVFALTIFTQAEEKQKRSLSGAISGTLDTGEYLVKSVLTIQPGDTLCIPAGATLYFGELSGIDVDGSLHVDGTPDSPVVLTSASDTAGSPGPAQGFDWNGVKTAGADAAIRLRHVGIAHSVYGVNVRDTLTKAEFVDVTFQNNGYASLVRGGEIIPIAPDEPFSARWNVADTSAVQSLRVDREPAKKRGGINVNTKFVFNASAVGVAAVGVAVYSIGLSNNSTYFKHYSQDGNSKRLSTYYENEIRGSINVSTVGAVMAGIGLGCIGFSLFF